MLAPRLRCWALSAVNSVLEPHYDEGVTPHHSGHGTLGEPPMWLLNTESLAPRRKLTSRGQPMTGLTSTSLAAALRRREEALYGPAKDFHRQSAEYVLAMVGDAGNQDAESKRLKLGVVIVCHQGVCGRPRKRGQPT